jgi:predicted lipid carrier protein YhbT
MTDIIEGRSACLPRLLALPIAMTPGVVHASVAARALNHALAAQLARDELDFLSGRRVLLHVQDAGMRLMLTCGDNGLAPARGAPDLVVRGSLYDFMLLAARRVDPDTLFFQRRLCMEGDTELGLGLKNFLAALDEDEVALLRPLDFLLQRSLPVYQRLFG